VLGSAGPVDWQGMKNTTQIREAISRIVPGMEQVAEIDKTGKEFHITGRVLHMPVFPTPSGKAKLFTHSLPELAGDKNTLRLMTIRSEGQFNTVVYEDYDLYRGIDRRDVILLHPDDICRLGLKPEQLVVIRSDAGEMRGIIARAFDKIKPGNAAMYYPECNILVPRQTDPASRTPSFKSVLVRIEAMANKGTALPVLNGKEGTNGESVKTSRENMRAC
jgi:anaerobic selenocysteine-containing dehydrogenase